MLPGTILQVIMVLTGLFLLVITVNSLARRKMTESFCLAWGLISLILVVAGFFLRPAGWSRYLSNVGMALVVLLGFCVIYVAYFLSVKISELSRKNQELAIQITLLNEENKRVLDQLEMLSAEDAPEQGK